MDNFVKKKQLFINAVGADIKQKNAEIIMIGINI